MSSLRILSMEWLLLSKLGFLGDDGQDVRALRNAGRRARKVVVDDPDRPYIIGVHRLLVEHNRKHSAECWVCLEEVGTQTPLSRKRLFKSVDCL